MKRMTERRSKGTIIIDHTKHHESAIRRLAAIEDILGDEYELTDVAPVRHAHWFDVGSLSCRCSGCGCKNDRETAYCPHCGALMDGNETPTCHDGVCEIPGVEQEEDDCVE